MVVHSFSSFLPLIMPTAGNGYKAFSVREIPKNWSFIKLSTGFIKKKKERINVKLSKAYFFYIFNGHSNLCTIQSMAFFQKINKYCSAVDPLIPADLLFFTFFAHPLSYVHIHAHKLT